MTRPRKLALAAPFSPSWRLVCTGIMMPVGLVSARCRRDAPRGLDPIEGPRYA